MYSNDRGWTKATKNRDGGDWETVKTLSEKNCHEMTMVMHNDHLLVRHRDAADVVFQEFDKDTLKPIEGQQPFKVPEGEDDYLKWTPLDTAYESNTQEGNRWHRASPMFSDGECIYMLVQYKETAFTTRCIKTVLEVYNIDMDNRTMTRINEQPLYRSEGNYYIGSKSDLDQGGFLARGSIACNQEVLLFWARSRFHVYQYSDGKRVRIDY